jgi:hypothetical protein
MTNSNGGAAATEQLSKPSPSFAGSNGEEPFQIELELVVQDREVIRSLAEHAEGDERNQFALEALKIGVLALRHVGGQATADLIQRESARLIRDVQQAFSQHKQLIHERLDGSLKEYFDPQNGRFHDRVQRLVSDDGELVTIIKRMIGADDSQLARTLLAHVGRDSPLMKHLDPEQAKGLLATLRQTVETQLAAQRDHVLKEFSLDNKESALTRLKSELAELLAASDQKNQKFQEEVKVSLARMVTTRQEAERSTRHGLAFQDAVCEFLIREAQHAGDIAMPTGNTTGQIKNCKVGDCVVELGPDSAAPGAKIAVEAKEMAGYTLASAREEIETARKNRGAEWGLFVFSRKTAPAGLDPFQRYGNDFVVIWDAEDPSMDVFLKAGVIAARALCFRAERRSAAEQMDFNAIDKAILEVERRAGNLDEVRKAAESIQSSSARILDRVRIDREALETQVAALREKTAELRNWAVEKS